jgi:tRNA (guanine37-N1)-methyltransferase
VSYQFDVVTIFGPLMTGYLGGSILGRAANAGRISVRYENPRDHTHDVHKSVDDGTYGGGAGMLMTPGPLGDAIDAVRARQPDTRVVLLGPAGRRFDQQIAEEYAQCGALTLVCGRYEGVDERIAAHAVDEELSVGDFVITGGELAAMTVIDAVSRLLPGVLGHADAAVGESFTDLPLLEQPQYTRPRQWRGHGVPDVLLSGNHGAVDAWRLEQRIARTKARRPDLYAKYLAQISAKESDKA